MSRIRAVLPFLLLAAAITLAFLVLRPAGPLTPDSESQEFELFAAQGPEDWKRTMSFLDGDYGHVKKGGTIYNRDSHLDFERYHEGCFTVGIQGKESGVITDLGSIDDLLPGGPATALFEDLRLRDGELYLGTGTVGTLSGAGSFVPIEVGHVYVAVIDRGKSHPDLDVAAVILVLEYEPGKRVKFRWGQL